MGYAAWGESSILQDKSGRWHGYVSVGLKSDGSRDRRHVSAMRRADVVRQVRALEQRRDRGTVAATAKPPSVAEWMNHWLDNSAAARVRPSTLDGYRSTVRNRIIPALGHHRLDRLQPEHLEVFYAEMLANGLSPASVVQTHRILTRALKVAVQRDRIGRNVCTLVDAPSLVRAEVEPLTAHEAKRILQAAAGQRNAARWSVALALGLRQGEALGLPWSAVDLDRGTVAIKQALQRQKGRGLVIVQPKSRAGRRTLALPRVLRTALLEHRAQQDAERAAAEEAWQEHGLVFTQPDGRPIDNGADWKAWKQLLRQAGVRDARLHDARHTAATLMLLQGVPARVAMQVLGHSQIGLTLGTYSHVAPELSEEAAERVASVLWD